MYIFDNFENQILDKLLKKNRGDNAPHFLYIEITTICIFTDNTL